MPISPFHLPYSQSAAADLGERLGRTRWPDEVPGACWDYGTNLEFLQELCAYWQHQFDWKAQIERLTALQHFRFLSNGPGIHFIHERGKGPAPIPIVLTHGWPGSFLEMLHIIPLLVDPEAHGCDPTDSFDVVVPSLPGYGFSDRPGCGMNAQQIAGLWNALMHELGYARFGAQGGDIGASVSTCLGLRHPDSVMGIHLNYIPGSYHPFLAEGSQPNPEEERFLQQAALWNMENGAYAHIQGTRPQTAAYGLNDSPAALAAWILEKFRAWSDCDGNVYTRFTRDELLTNITLYWMTETIHSSFRLYYEGRKSPLRFGEDDFVRVPCAIARFPREIYFPPREWVARGYNVQQWTEMPRGGHFAAAEEPALLAQDIRTFFRRFR